MAMEPGFAAFRDAYEAGRAQIVWTRLVADLETPVSAFLKLADGRSHTVLLESVEGGAVRGRYSAIGFKPDLIWEARGDTVRINRHARRNLHRFEPVPAAPLESLNDLLIESAIDLPPGFPPIAAGLFGYVGYDMVRHFEPKVPSTRPDPLGLPDAVLMRPTIVAVFDTIEDMVTLVTPVRPRPGVSADAAYALAGERLSDVVADFERSLAQSRQRREVVAALPDAVSNTSPNRFRAMVSEAQALIAAGDIFQVVLSQRFTIPFDLPAFSLYRALRRLNPSPFMVFVDLGGFQIVAASPEILVRLRDNEVTIRPIAGTRPRGSTPETDAALADDLLADPKERAEHLMLLDLGRNDVGRVARIGTVQVTDQFTVERYSHVMHIVSNVVGQLKPGLTAIDALAAGFPAGTVSGAPKVRAMEIIDALETDKRGVYAGGVGYFGAGGSMDTCIALRTAVVADGHIHIQAGAGIVADSDPEAEHQECRHKARAILRAAEEAVRFANRPGFGTND